LLLLVAADEVAHLELWPAQVDAAVGLQAGPELQLEVEVLVERPHRVQVADAAAAPVVLLVHDDGAVLDLDAAGPRRGLAVERPVLVLPAGQVLAVEQAGVALLRLLRVVGLPAGHAAGQAQRQPQRYQPAPLEAHHTTLPKTVFLNDLEG